MLTKQKGNMYEFISHTWNPVRGRCLHMCDYCYMKKWKLGEIALHEDEFKTKLGKGNFIFIGSGTDMWAKDVPVEWIEKVLEHTRKYPESRYLFQSKNPMRFLDFLEQMPPNVVFGTTIESNRKYGVSKAPSYNQRASALGELKEIGFETMVTIEPILDFDLNELVQLIRTANPVWINIGADSKGHKLPEPTPEQIEELVEKLQKETDVKLKRNIERILGAK